MNMISGWCRSGRRLQGLTAIVTGCNTGIGKETVRDFYQRGARVIMACRDVQKAEVAKSSLIHENNKFNGELIVEALDLSRMSSVRDFSTRVLAKERQINILVNNAGVMMCPQGKTEDGFEMQMATNHLGHSLLTLLLLPRMRQSAPARIVFVSSLVHDRHELDLNDLNYETTPYDPMKAYSWSKSANILFAASLGKKLKEHGIDDVTTYSLHPGIISTEISRHFSDTMWPGATWVFNHLLSWFLKTPRCGAQTTIYCAVDEQCSSESGLYYSDCKPVTPSVQCRSEEAINQMWNWTINSLNLGNYDPFTKEDPKI